MKCLIKIPIPRRKKNRSIQVMDDINITIPAKPKRRLLPNDFEVSTWDKLKPYFEELKNRPICSKQELLDWMSDRSELEAVLSEDAGWRYIKMTIDTTDEALAESYRTFVTEIHPHSAAYQDLFNRKFVESEFSKSLVGKEFELHNRELTKAIELFREENILLAAEVAQESQKFGALSGAQSIQLDGNEFTMQQAAKELKNQDRDHRKHVFEKMMSRRMLDREALDDLFDVLLGLRNKIALNADFNNFRDYKFESMGRFDYTVQDCFDFHESIEKEIVPIITEFNKARKAALGYDVLLPYDLEVDPEGNNALKPFDGGEELLQKSMQLFYKIHPYFGECLETMKEMGHLDLDSKQGKAPGGYNYPLYEIGVPFIFMNSVGTQRDLITMVHEGGHAVHSFLTRELKLTAFKSLPSEVAELASMSMELISMEFWDIFYSDKNELKRAKRDQLETLLKILPWVATVDKFQHWIYTNPEHTKSERTEAWNEISTTFSGGLVDWSGYPEAKSSSWQRQLHIFEVPFYYIEYGMAQLGAIAVWRNYKQDPEKALEHYIAALKLGSTRSIPEVYETAGIQFDFSREYVRELVSFVMSELEQLK